MVTINGGESVPQSYKSIQNLPDIIDTIERSYPNFDSDGDLTRTEVFDWFEIAKSTESLSDTQVRDRMNRSRHKRAFQNFSGRQWLDLLEYFKQSYHGDFPGYEPGENSPIQSHQNNRDTRFVINFDSHLDHYCDPNRVISKDAGTQKNFPGSLKSRETVTVDNIHAYVDHFVANGLYTTPETRIEFEKWQIKNILGIE